MMPYNMERYSMTRYRTTLYDTSTVLYFPTGANMKQVQYHKIYFIVPCRKICLGLKCPAYVAVSKTV